MVRRALSPFLLMLLVALGGVGTAHAEEVPVDGGPPHPMVFPVVGEVSYTDTYGAPRSGGRMHAGQDLMGRKMQQLVAAADGTITYVKAGGTLAGNMVELTGVDGWVYSYLHLNNDTPGTDDGAASLEDILGPGIAVGVVVK